MLSPMVLTKAIAADILATLVAAGGTFEAVFAGVGSAIVATGPDTTLAAITPVVGAAGVRQAVVWGAPYELGDGRAVVDSAALVFEPAGAEEDAVAVVFLATLAVAGALVGYMTEPVPPQIRLNRPYSVVLRLVVDPNGRWSVSFSWNGV